MNNLRECSEKICEIGRRLYDRRMVSANDGNISIRLSQTEILCTPTGISKGLLTPQCLCIVDNEGSLLHANGEFRPSSEMKMHLCVYQKREDINAVVHAHPVFATAFAIQGIALEKPIMPEVIINFKKVPIAAYGTPSTQEIPDHLEPFLQDYNAVLLESHGAITYADTLEMAMQRMESVEFYAELLYRTKMLGGSRVLSDDKIEKLYEIKHQSR